MEHVITETPTNKQLINSSLAMEVIRSITSYEELKDVLVSKLPSRETLSSKPVVIAIGVTAATVSTYVWYRFKFRYWKSRGIDGPPPSFPFGNGVELTTKTFTIFSEWEKKYGSIYGIYILYGRCLVISDPEILKEIIVNSNFFDRPSVEANLVVQESLINKNGVEWRHDRSIMSPSFTSGKMKLMYPLMQNSLEHLYVELDELSVKGEEFNPKDTLTKLTAMVIARCAFATEVNAFAKGDQHPLIKHLSKIGTVDLFRILVFIFTPSFIRKKLQMHTSHPASFNYIVSLLKSIIKTRKENKIKTEYNDLLQLLLDTQSEKDGLSDDKIVANSFLFFLAGLETTSGTLNLIAYILTMNPDVQEKLYQEVSSVGSLNYETLFDLKYLDAVINETLRMFSAPQIARICKEEYKLPNGFTIPAMTTILIPIQAIHKNELYHPEPEKFDPSRFLPENKDSIAPCTFMPFVAGPRNCIGMRFALLQIKLTLAEVILKYKFVKGPRTPEKFDIKLFGTQMKTFVKIEKREK